MRSLHMQRKFRFKQIYSAVAKIMQPWNMAKLRKEEVEFPVCHLWQWEFNIRWPYLIFCFILIYIHSSAV